MDPDGLPTLLAWLVAYGYLARFVILFVEGVGVPLPLPGDLALLFAGYLVGRGVLRFDLTLLVALAAVLGGASALYAADPGHLDHVPAGLLLALIFGSALTADPRAQAALGLGYVAVPNAVLGFVGTPPGAVATVNWYVISGALSSLLLACLIDAANRRAFALELALEAERRRSEALLRSILPASVVERLNDHAGRVADLVEDAGVLFADIVGFTALAHRLPPDQLVDTLDRIFTDLDAVAARHGVEKIKTIGDAYMVAVGVAGAAGRDVASLVEFALEAREAVGRHTPGHGAPIHLRVGLCAGPVISAA